MKIKQLCSVLDALALGAETSHEVAAVTNLSVKIASAWLSLLADDTDLVIRWRLDAMKYNRSGRKSHYYKLRNPKMYFGEKTT